MSKALDELTNILNIRGREYGTEADDKANLREAERIGISPLTGVIIRAGDKWGRIVSLMQPGKPGLDIDQLRDQMLDLAGYMIKGVELLDERESRLASEDFTIEPASNDAYTRPQRRRWLRSLFGW